MSSNLAPLLIGFAAAGLLLGLIGLALTARRVLERKRLKRRRRGAEAERLETSQEWVYRPRAPREARAESDVSFEAARGRSGDESEAGAEKTAAETVEDARRVAQRLLEEAEREAKEIAAAAERQRGNLLQTSETEAEQQATEITVGARKQADDLLEKARLEAREIVATAHRERARLLGELARERALAEETRTRLSSFLHGVLEEVESTSVNESPPNVHALSEARGIKTSAGADE